MKPLLCLFLNNVLCSYRKTEKVTVMSRCFKCRHHRRFLREMAEEDKKVMDEIDEIREHPERYRRGELG